ncbi:transposase [Bradyrhizobium sp.]|uniref:transposase n=1 Tax=Bradyrhizobium sp. TaxID=376 RepID=UPI003524266A
MVLPTAGNSNTSERTELLDRLRAAFPSMKIAALMGDREFIGDAWMAYLQREKIAFILRLRENQHVLRRRLCGYADLRHRPASQGRGQNDRQGQLLARPRQ